MSNRVHEIAKKFGMETKDFVKKIVKIGINKDNPLNKLSEDEIKKIENELKEKTQVIKEKNDI